MVSNSEAELLKKIADIEEELLRKKAEPSKPAEEGESWLISYADMMTLLCGFFIMMYSMAKLDIPEYEKVQLAMAQHFGTQFKSKSTEMAQFLTQVIDSSGETKDQMSVQVEGGSVNLIFQSTALFDSKTSELSPKGVLLLNKLSDQIQLLEAKEGKTFPIAIEGHTDSTPVTEGEYRSNWELSSAKASEVLRRFVDRGISPKQMAAIGYGDTRPEVPPRNPDGSWNENALRKNRRVVVRVLSSDAEAIPLAKQLNPPGK